MTDSDSAGGNADTEPTARARSDWFASWAESVSEINARLEVGRRATDEYLAAMARAIDEGIGEIVTNFTWRCAQLEGRIENVAGHLADQNARIDAAVADRDARSAEQVEAFDASLRERFDTERDATLRQLAALSEQLGAELSEGMAELRTRIETELLDRIAALGHDLANGRAALDAQIEALSSHAGRAEARAAEIGAELEVVKAQLATVDIDALSSLESKVSNAVGEATLARIEVDRITATVGERFDHIQVRLSEVETQLADTMDVSTAVQLERLDELERAIAELDPDQFVRNENYDPDAAHAGDDNSAGETGDDTSWAIERINDAASW